MRKKLPKRDLTRINDITKEQWELAHLQLQETIDVDSSPLDNPTEREILHPEEHLLSIMMNPDYFGWTCRKLFNTAISENGLELLPMQCAILREMWYRPFPMLIASRGFGKSFTLALYSILRALFLQGRKIIITGAGFRQSKIVFSYAELIWYNSPILRDLCGAAHDRNQGPHHDTDVWWMQLGASQIKAIPLGDGSKIRGQRANDIIADEFASIPQQVFEEVVAGFGVVNLDPIEKVKHYQRMEYLQSMNNFSDADMKENQLNADEGIIGNQTIISGTASFSFNHFYTYWKKQHNIIASRGDKRRLQDLGIDPNLDHTKYSIIRIPVDLLPKGFMDDTHVARSESTVSVGIFNNEFGACFSADSSGFFRRSILEKAMPSFKSPVILPSGEVIEVFSALLQGNRDKKYIMAIDTASERDKFAIVILEVYPNYAKIVYCWTTDRQEHIEKRTVGAVNEKDFFAYTLRKIRDLMKSFNVIHIAMDSQGGGRTLAELLHNERYLEPGEQLIWEINENSLLWDRKTRLTDDEPGLHILEMCNFRDNKYMSDANHGMKNDFEQKILLFPYFDAIEVVVAGKEDLDAGRTHDTLDDVVTEINELKDELQTIMHDGTDSGMEKWTLPKVKDVGDVGRLYDDRYSALLMANAAARRIRETPKQEIQYVGGGFVGQISTDEPASSQLYVGPAWFTERTRALGTYGILVER